MKILFLVGISGAGKSTYTKQFIKENRDYIRINRDAIRLALIGDLNGYYQRKDLNQIEEITNEIIENIIDQAVYYDYNLIVDNTNLKRSYHNSIIQYVQHVVNDLKIDYKFFDIGVNEARKRVSKRENYPSHISMETDYINKQYQQYLGIKKEILKNSLTTQN